MLLKRKDSVEFTLKLKEANAKLKAEKEQEERRRAQEACAKQMEAIEEAKQKYMEKFLERHVEFLEERDGFYRMTEDCKTYAAKPWYIYVDIKGDIVPEVYKNLKKGGWEIGTLDDKLVIYPAYELSIFQRFLNWIRGLFKKQETVISSEEDAEEFEEADETAGGSGPDFEAI